MVTTISDSIVTIKSPCDTPMQSLKVYFSPIQNGSGDPSPTNVRPITGRTGLEVTHCGNNMNSGTTIPVDWTSEVGTIYGGYVDLISGELVQTHSLWEMDGTTAFHRFGAQGGRSGTQPYNYYFPIEEASTLGDTARVVGKDELTSLGIFSTHYPNGHYATASDLPCFGAYIGSSGTRFQPRIGWPYESGMDTTEKANAWLKEQYDNGTPFRFTYILRNPVHYQLSPQTLSILRGHNNIFSSANGECEVTYDHRDTNEIVNLRHNLVGSLPHIATASGSVASFNTDMQNAITDGKIYFGPIQDTHDIAVRPAGNSKNMLTREDGRYHNTSTSYLYFSASAITLEPGTYYLGVYGHPDDGNYSKGLYVKVNGGTASRIGSNFSTKYAVRTYVVEETANFTFYIYSTNLVNMPRGFRFMLSTSELTASADGYEPYSNICPIYGRTGLDITVTKKNLCDSTASLISNPMSNTGNSGLGLYLPAGTYTAVPSVYNESNTYGYLRYHIIHPDGAYDSYVSFSTAVSEDPYRVKTFTLKDGDWLFMYASASNSNPDNIKTAKVQVELGDTATTYEDYAGTTTHISFPVDAGTVYGGYVDLVAGELVVTYGYKVMDGVTNAASDLYGPVDSESDFTNLRGTYTVLLADLPNDVPYNDGHSICSHFRWLTYTSRRKVLSDIEIYYSSSNRTVRWASSVFTTLQEFNDYLIEQSNAGTPVTLVYPLGTPVVYQLDPVTIRSLQGYNNIYCPAGTMEVSYWTH